LTPKDDRLYVAHIRECIRRVEEDTAFGRDAFFANRTAQDAVLRNLQILSESTQRLSQSSKDKHPHIPWRNIGGFRNRLVHDYFRIDLDLVWRVVETHLPELKQAVLQIEAGLGSAPPGNP
jgi:uncharacterized protein with HEPN domain